MTHSFSQAFNPANCSRRDLGIFGLPFDYAASQMVILPVPWDVTTSFRAGTSGGPAAILAQSSQMDLVHPFKADLWQRGIYMADISTEWLAKNNTLRPKAEQLISALDRGLSGKDPSLAAVLAYVNAHCQTLHEWVQSECRRFLSDRKQVVILGGEHSVSLGYLNALSEIHSEFGILQIDAHMDLRDAYEGFTYSHASIMFNALKNPAIQRLVQVGIRDYSDEEWALAHHSNGRVRVFDDFSTASRLMRGNTWHGVCEDIVAALPDKIYVSMDIDGLDIPLCPNTGTPVPGGLSWHQWCYLLSMVAQSGKTVIGIDLVEVQGDTSPDPERSSVASANDAIVGSRALWMLCGLFQ